MPTEDSSVDFDVHLVLSDELFSKDDGSHICPVDISDEEPIDKFDVSFKCESEYMGEIKYGIEQIIPDSPKTTVHKERVRGI